jgi:hypothetical protein
MLTIVKKVLGMAPEPLAAPPETNLPSLRINRHGFAAVAGTGQALALDWKDIVRIFAFRRDRGVSDLVCLEFEDRQGRRIIIHEDMEGFMPVIKRMRSEFPRISRDWYIEALQPGLGQELYKRLN